MVVAISDKGIRTIEKNPNHGTKRENPASLLYCVELLLYFSVFREHILQYSYRYRVAFAAVLIGVAVALVFWRQTVETKSTNTVTYTLDKRIAAVDQVNDDPGELKSMEPIASVLGTIIGDGTHASRVQAEVFAARGDASGKTIVMRIPSPGFSSSETLSVSSASFSGRKLIVKYAKTSPDENTDDFRQFITFVHIQTAG
jgi:hypothetical protein